jgi:hypothetical protein
MSRNEIIQRAKELFGENINIIYRTTESALWHFDSGIVTAGNYSLSRRTFGIIIKVRSPEYRQDYVEGNINFYFYGDKLGEINIYWAASPEEVLTLARRQFGEPITINCVDTSINSSYIAYRWSDNGRDIFLARRLFAYFDPQVHLDHIAYQEQLRQQRIIENAERESQRQAAMDAMIF